MRQTDDRVATLDVMIEETERMAGHVSFEPQGNFAQLDRERIEIHAVDAMADGIANGFPESSRTRLVVAGSQHCQLCADAPGGGEQNVAGAARHVADFQCEERLLFFRDCGAFAQRFGNEVIERMFEERLDEFLRRVVRACMGAFVAGGERESGAVVRGVTRGSNSRRPW